MSQTPLVLAGTAPACPAATPAKPASARLCKVVAVGSLFSLLWSSAFIAAKIGLQSAPPLALLAMRFALASLCLIALVAARHRRRRVSLRLEHVGVLVLAGILNNTVYLGLGWIALQTVPAGFATLLTSVYPLVTSALAIPLLREHATWPRFAGLGLGAAGVALVVHQHVSTAGVAPLGVGLLLLGVLALACGTILLKRTAAHQDFLLVTALQTIAGAVSLTVLAGATGEFHTIHWQASLVVALLYLAGGVSIGAALMWLWLLGNGVASNASAFHFLNPLFGTLIAFAVLGEPLNASDLLGGLPIAAGILLMTFASAARDASGARRRK